MIALDRILVPHDFTENATAALDAALTLSEILDARCEVLHVVDRAGSDVKGVVPAGITVKRRYGVPHAEIVRYATERDSDLIVMGTHGRQGLAHALLGSVAERVVRRAPCPVLTVRRPCHGAVATSILVATDFGAAADAALRYGRTFAHLFDARLHLLHVVQNSFLRPVASDPRALEEAARQQLRSRLTPADARILHATAVLDTSDSPAGAIVDYARNEHIDLIVMGTHGRQALDRFLSGSVAERVVRTASCQVLTVHHPDGELAAAG